MWLCARVWSSYSKLGCFADSCNLKLLHHSPKHMALKSKLGFSFLSLQLLILHYSQLVPHCAWGCHVVQLLCLDEGSFLSLASSDCLQWSVHNTCFNIQILGLPKSTCINVNGSFSACLSSISWFILAPYPACIYSLQVSIEASYYSSVCSVLVSTHSWKNTFVCFSCQMFIFILEPDLKPKIKAKTMSS